MEQISRDVLVFCVARDRAAEPPFLWNLSTGRPTAALDGLRSEAMAGWPAGVYEGPRLLLTAVVVLAELPRVRSTVLIRLMGGGRVLREAIDDFSRLRRMRRSGLSRSVVCYASARRSPSAGRRRRRKPEEAEFVMTTQALVEQFIEQRARRGSRRAPSRCTKLASAPCRRCCAPPSKPCATCRRCGQGSSLSAPGRARRRTTPSPPLPPGIRPDPRAGASRAATLRGDGAPLRG
ncbi:hypothetical protein [Sorangium sp. So ce362]|uniref:hypothetical protein n=1 Tax=Sorangium sp. So ce362 TaxID=3133303 RepID=UPI003F612DE8